MRIWIKRRLWKAWRVGFGTLYSYRTFIDGTGRTQYCVIDGPTWACCGIEELFHAKYVTHRFPSRPITRVRFFLRALFGPMKVYDIDPAMIQAPLWAATDSTGRLAILSPEAHVAIKEYEDKAEWFASNRIGTES